MVEEYPVCISEEDNRRMKYPFLKACSIYKSREDFIQPGVGQSRYSVLADPSTRLVMALPQRRQNRSPENGFNISSLLR